VKNDTQTIWDRARGYQSRIAELGALVTDADILQPAGTLLDLYGEDIRARAFTTQDPLRGEQDDTSRPSEFVQVGYEVFDGSNPAAADAEVFATIADLLSDVAVTASTGDIGILRAAVQGLNTTDRRRSALMRHLWRPRRFKALLDRFSGLSEMPAARVALLDQADPMSDLPPILGLRTESEIALRIDALREDAATDPISNMERDLLDALLQVRATAPNALIALRDIAVDLPSISPAVNGLAARLDTLAARGVDVVCRSRRDPTQVWV